MRLLPCGSGARQPAELTLLRRGCTFTLATERKNTQHTYFAILDDPIGLEKGADGRQPLDLKGLLFIRLIHLTASWLVVRIPAKHTVPAPAT